MSQTTISQIVDKTLHNVMGLLEGFYSTKSVNDEYDFEFMLQVVIKNQEQREVERM